MANTVLSMFFNHAPYSSLPMQQLQTHTTSKTVDAASTIALNPYMTTFEDSYIPNYLDFLKVKQSTMNPDLAKIEQAKGTLSPWLNISERYKPYSPAPSNRMDALALEPNNIAQSIRHLTKTFPTFCDFMQMSLYDKDIGYYSTGKVKFGNTDTDHFTTFPNHCSPWYGKLVMEQAFNMWQSMIADGDLGPKEPFTILELGAGNGRLAHDILCSAKERAKLDPEKWAPFYCALQYQIVEHSPALQKTQKTLLAEHGHKAIVLQGDARSVGNLFHPGSIKGLVFTNELPDAFPVHSARTRTNGELDVRVLFPFLSRSVLERLQSLGIDVRKLLEKDASYGERFSMRMKANPNDIVLSKRDLKKIVQVLDQNNLSSKDFISFTDYKDFYLSDEGFPDVKAYRIRHRDSIACLEKGSKLTVNLGMEPFIKNVSKILGKGFMTTIDYGYTDKEWAEEPCNKRYFRCFPNKDPFENVAALDITTDIPWTQFNREGEKYFDFQFFGYQNALGTPPYFSQMQQSTQNCWLKKDFKMHIQKIKGTQASYCPPAQQLPLLNRIQRASMPQLNSSIKLVGERKPDQETYALSKRHKS